MIRQAPKALLHDHLDGGLRPATVLDIAGEIGYDELPADRRRRAGDVVSHRRAQRFAGALPRAVRAHRRRHADPRGAAPGGLRVRRGPGRRLVVYAEVRFAPELHINRGLSLDEVVDAVLAGFADGEKAARGRGTAHHGALPGDRDAPRRPVAGDRRAGDPVPRQGRRRIRHRRRRGRVPADPAPRRVRVHARATTRASPFTPARRSGCRPSTRRSRSAAPTGWATGCASSTTSRSVADGAVRLGRLAAILRDKRIPLEMCPSSNVQTGAVAQHRRAPVRPAGRGCGSGSPSTPTTG